MRTMPWRWRITFTVVISLALVAALGYFAANARLSSENVRPQADHAVSVEIPGLGGAPPGYHEKKIRLSAGDRCPTQEPKKVEYHGPRSPSRGKLVPSGATSLRACRYVGPLFVDTKSSCPKSAPVAVKPRKGHGTLCYPSGDAVGDSGPGRPEGVPLASSSRTRSRSRIQSLVRTLDSFPPLRGGIVNCPAISREDSLLLLFSYQGTPRRLAAVSISEPSVCPQLSNGEMNASGFGKHYFELQRAIRELAPLR